MTNYKVPYINFQKQWSDQKADLTKIFSKVFKNGNFINGSDVEKLEKSLCKKFGFQDCVALNSGTDSLVLGMHLSGIKKDDEVITPPNSFIASTGAIVHLGAKPIFADVMDNLLMDPKDVEKRITKKTKAIMAVNLSGKVSNLEELNYLSKKYNLRLIEDAAQSIGSKFKDRYAGTWGDLGCFSAHPLKNLNAAGDAGFLTSKKNINRARLIRNHGLIDRNSIKEFGYVSRLDTLQAAFLNYRLTKLDQVIKKRKDNARLYLNQLSDLNIILPKEEIGEFHTYHTFVIQVSNRSRLINFLKQNGIETSIHYPKPINVQKPSINLNFNIDTPNSKKQALRILSLPIHQYLTKKDIEYVCDKIRKFYKK